MGNSRFSKPGFRYVQFRDEVEKAIGKCFKDMPNLMIGIDNLGGYHLMHRGALNVTFCFNWSFTELHEVERFSFDIRDWYLSCEIVNDSSTFYKFRCN